MVRNADKRLESQESCCEKECLITDIIFLTKRIADYVCKLNLRMRTNLISQTSRVSQPLGISVHIVVVNIELTNPQRAKQSLFSCSEIMKPLEIRISSVLYVLAYPFLRICFMGHYEHDLPSYDIGLAKTIPANYTNAVFNVGIRGAGRLIVVG